MRDTSALGVGEVGQERICEALVRERTSGARGVALVRGRNGSRGSLGSTLVLSLGANLEALGLRGAREGALSESADAAEMRLGGDWRGGHLPGGGAAEGDAGEGLGDGDGRHDLSDSLGRRRNR